jgi:DnaK suppressor protein
MKAAAKKKPATPARAPAKKMSKAPAKPAAKTGAKSAVKAKPAPKVAVKPVAKPGKPVAKSAKAAKPPAKSAVKPVAKPAVKPAAKSSAKPVASSKSASAKPALKKAASAVKPEARKSSGKSVTSAASKHAVAKPVPAKPGTSGKPAKPETKSVIKSSPKPSAKSESKSVASQAKPAAKPGVAVKVEKAVVAPAPAAAPVALQPGGLLPRPPLKPGRRSSARIASQSPPPAPMVPTHAPDAAKASYSTITERVIAPPPQAAAKKDPKLANNWKTKAGEALTDEEVKAMPDSEYMNDKQMAFFRHKLSVLKQDIHNSAGETTEHLREDTVVVPDPADRATIEEEHALELRTRDRERKLLKKIEQSIARIDSGDYGYCDETGEAIGVGRLIARPTANLSLEAQQRRELKQKMFGD